MQCPFCKTENDKVIDSRIANEGVVIRRRRECEACSKRYTTYERIEVIPLFVIKKDRRRELYDRSKILNGLYRACGKRPVSLEQQEGIADAVERMIREEHEKEVSAAIIGEFIMKQLSRIDQVAYVRFASVYREFQDVGHFMKELKALIAAK